VTIISQIHTSDYCDLRHILWLLFANGPMTLAELTLGVAPKERRCRDLVDLLLQRGLVVESQKLGRIPLLTLSNSYFKPGNRVLAELFMCRKVNSSEVRLYVMLMQVMACQQTPISEERLYYLIYESFLLERLEKEGMEYSGFYKERQFRSKLKNYVRVGLLKEIRATRCNREYFLNANFFDQLDDSQLARLLAGLQLLSASFIPVTPGTMLLESLREYMGEKSGEAFEIGLKSSRPQSALDEDVIWQLLQLAGTGKTAVITYLRRKGYKVHEAIQPEFFVYDADFSRWYVIGWQKNTVIIRRGDRIETVKEQKSNEPKHDNSKITQRLDQAWCISGVEGESPPLKVRVRFAAGHGYNLSVLRHSFLREDRKIPNRLVDEGDNYFVCEFTTLDSYELSQWLRRYGSCAEVLPDGDGAVVRQMMRDGWKELMEIYGAV